MKTKKNTKYNPDKYGVLVDILVVVFSLCAIAYTVFLFYRNLNKTFERTDKPAVALVTFKYKSVQRRFLDRAVWDRPVQYSPVYNGDTLRTAPDAEAVIYFPDKSILSVGSNTMIQIFKPVDRDTSVQISEGRVSVQTGGAKMTVKSGAASVSVEKDSVLHADKKDSANLRLAVEKGSADLSKAGIRSGTAQDEETEKLSAGSISSETDSAFVSVISPAPGAKILNQRAEGESIPVLFKWHSSFAEDTELVLETARSRDFKAGFQRFSVTGLNELTLEEKSGTVYWRLYAASSGAEDKSSDAGKFGILSAPPPRLLQPVSESRYSYKNELPSIRFLWQANDLVSSYTLEAADNPDMKNPVISRQLGTSSVTLSDLGEGQWYWRVIPAYFISEDIPIESSKVSAFYIERQKELAPIELLFPGQIADTAEGKSVNFSWKNIGEVQKYKLKIARSEHMGDIIIEKESERNYFELKKAAQTLPNGLYYWTVEGLDKNGIPVTSSKVSVFKTRDSEIILRSVFPPEDYVLAETLCFDTRFVWKTNLDTEQRFQVSSSRNFDNLLADIKVQGTALTGLSLKQGEYYWRVLVKSESEEFKTEAKKLIIASALPKPELIGMGDRVIIYPNEKNKFTWTEVPGVDYYQVKIMPPDPAADPLYENLFVTANDVEMLMHSIHEGNYIISVQGFASATITSSRRYGYAESRLFELKHLRPVELVSPASNAKINGVDAALNPGTLTWSSVDKPVNSRLILEKAGKKRSILSVANPGFTVSLPPLEAGTYRWRVSAATENGLDISSVKDSVFTVLPIEPLPSARFRFPSDKQVLDVSFFKTNRSIVFSWEKVRDATHYNLRLYNANKQKLFEREIGAGNASFEFTDLSLLGRGDFSAEVRALRRLSGGMLFQDGKASVCRFTIDLPMPAKVKTDAAGVMYGR